MTQVEQQYTVGCALRKLMLHEEDVDVIEGAVHRVHQIVILGTELANLLLRRWLELGDATKLAKLFDANFLCKLFNAVSSGNGRQTSYAEMNDVLQMVATNMFLVKKDDVLQLPSRQGLTQCLAYEARSLATVAANNVWMHFVKRLGSHVRNHLDDQRDLRGINSVAARTLRHQITLDMCRTPTTEYLSPVHYHAWIDSERLRLGLSDDLFVDSDLADLRPLLYHLKKSPERFLPAMDIMSRERERREQSAFALFPLRRSLTPRHVHLDEKCFRELLRLGANPQHVESRKNKKETHETNVENEVPVGKKRVRRSKEALVPEKELFFDRLVNLRSCQIRNPENFAFHLTTDGVCARVLMNRKAKPKNDNSSKKQRQFPTRGIWCIDALKDEARKSRGAGVHVIGIDPGKRELVVAVDMDETHQGNTKRERRGRSAVRYTQKQRAFEIKCGEYDATVILSEVISEKMESNLCGTNSRSASFDTFKGYVQARRQVHDVCLPLYANIKFRKRRWKTYMKTQRSEARLFNRLRSLHDKERDPRTMVLAYGSWGLVAGRAGMACNKGNPPCIGVGLMRKLARHFVVCPTPEAYTSKTCCKCLGTCGPCTEIDEERVLQGGKQVRGLRRCQNEECMIFLNRDRNGATNIGNNFKRLFGGERPICELNEAETQLHELGQLCNVA